MPFYKVIALLVIEGSVAFLWISLLYKRIHELKFEKKLNRNEAEDYREKLLDKVREKIMLTQRSESKVAKGEDLVASFIYRKDETKQLGEDLQALYEKQLGAIRNQYPTLTDLDILVIALLGIGYDNIEICSLLRMEKRTLYKRRQLIAQRIGISATDLDELAMKTLAED